MARLQDGYKLCDWRMAYGEAWLTWFVGHLSNQNHDEAFG